MTIMEYEEFPFIPINYPEYEEEEGQGVVGAEGDAGEEEEEILEEKIDGLFEKYHEILFILKEKKYQEAISILAEILDSDVLSTEKYILESEEDEMKEVSDNEKENESINENERIIVTLDEIKAINKLKWLVLKTLGAARIYRTRELLRDLEEESQKELFSTNDINEALSVREWVRIHVMLDSMVDKQDSAMNKSTLSEVKKQLVDAEKKYRYATVLNKKDVKSLYILGGVCISLGKYERCAKAFEECVFNSSLCFQGWDYLVENVDVSDSKQFQNNPIIGSYLAPNRGLFERNSDTSAFTLNLKDKNLDPYGWWGLEGLFYTAILQQDTETAGRILNIGQSIQSDFLVFDPLVQDFINAKNHESLRKTKAEIQYFKQSYKPAFHETGDIVHDFKKKLYEGIGVKMNKRSTDVEIRNNTAVKPVEIVFNSGEGVEKIAEKVVQRFQSILIETNQEKLKSNLNILGAKILLKEDKGADGSSLSPNVTELADMEMDSKLITQNQGAEENVDANTEKNTIGDSSPTDAVETEKAIENNENTENPGKELSDTTCADDTEKEGAENGEQTEEAAQVVTRRSTRVRNMSKTSSTDNGSSNELGLKAGEFLNNTTGGLNATLEFPRKNVEDELRNQEDEKLTKLMFYLEDYCGTRPTERTGIVRTRKENENAIAAANKENDPYSMLLKHKMWPIFGELLQSDVFERESIDKCEVINTSVTNLRQILSTYTNNDSTRSRRKQKGMGDKVQNSCVFSNSTLEFVDTLEKVIGSRNGGIYGFVFLFIQEVMHFKQRHALIHKDAKLYYLLARLIIMGGQVFIDYSKTRFHSHKIQNGKRVDSDVKGIELSLYSLDLISSYVETQLEQNCDNRVDLKVVDLFNRWGDLIVEELARLKIKERMNKNSNLRTILDLEPLLILILNYNKYRIGVCLNETVSSKSALKTCIAMSQNIAGVNKIILKYNKLKKKPMDETYGLFETLYNYYYRYLLMGGVETCQDGCVAVVPKKSINKATLVEFFTGKISAIEYVEKISKCSGYFSTGEYGMVIELIGPIFKRSISKLHEIIPLSQQEAHTGDENSGKSTGGEVDDSYLCELLYTSYYSVGNVKAAVLVLIVDLAKLIHKLYLQNTAHQLGQLIARVIQTLSKLYMLIKKVPGFMGNKMDGSGGTLVDFIKDSGVFSSDETKDADGKQYVNYLVDVITKLVIREYSKMLLVMVHFLPICVEDILDREVNWIEMIKKVVPDRYITLIVQLSSVLVFLIQKETKRFEMDIGKTNAVFTILYCLHHIMGKFGLCTYQDPEKISQPQVSDDKMETDGQKSLNNEKSDAKTAAHTESGDKIQMDVYLEHKSGFGGLVVDLSGEFISKHYKDYCRDKARFATVNQQQGDPDVMQKAIGLFIQSVLCVYDVSVEVELQNELWEIVVHYQYNNNSDDGCCGRGGEGEDGEGEDGEDTGSEMSIQTTSVIFALLKNQLYESFRNNKPGILKQRRGLIELVYESCAEFTANNDLFTLVNLTLHASNSSGNLERRSEESGTVAIANSLGMNNSALNSLLFNATSVRNYLNKFNYQKILSEFSADTHSSTPKPVFMNSDTNGIVSDMYSNIYFIYASIQRDAIRVKKYSDPLRSAFEFASIINMCYINLHFNPKHWANWYVLGQSVLERVDYLLISGADSVSEMLPKPKTKSSSDGDTDKNNDTNTNTNTDADLKSGTSTGTGTSMVTGKEPEKSRTFTQHLSLSSSSIEQSSLASNSTSAAAIAAEKTTSTSAFENKALEMYPETTTNCRSGKDKDKDKDDGKGKGKGKGNSSNNEDGNGDDDGDDDDDDEYPVRSYNIVWSYKVALLCFAQAIRLFESDAAINTENCLPASISFPYELYYSTASLLYRMSSFPFNDNKSFSNILYSSVYNLVLKSKQQMLYSSTVPLFNQVSLELLLAKTLSKLNMKPEACLMFIKALYMGYKQPLLPGKPESGTGNILTGFTDLCIEPLVKFLATLTKLLLCDAICTCRAAKYISSLPGFPKIIEDNVDDASISSQTSPDIRSRSFSGSFRGEAGKSNAGGSVIYKHDSVKNSNKEVYVISSDEGDDSPASPKKKQKLSHYTTKTSPKTKEQDSLCPQCRGNLIYSKKSVFTTILHLLEQISVFDKKKTHHKYVFLQAYIYYHFFRDFVKARNSISNIVHLKLSGGRGLTSFYKTEMEFSGKFYYYAEKYALFAIKIMYNVSDSSAKAYSTSLDYYSWCQTFISGVDDFHTACKKVIVTENVFLNREIICNIARLYLYKLIVKKYKYVVNSCCTFFKLVPFYQSTNTAAIDDFQSTFFCGPMFLNIDKHKLDICHRSMLARIKRLLYIGKRSSAHSSLDNYFLSLYKQTYFLLLFLHRLFANIRKIPSNFNPQVFEQLPLNDPYFVYDVDLLSIDIYCRLLTFFGKSSPSYFITDGSLSSETSHDISGQDGPSLVELVDDFMLDLNNSSSHYQDSSTPDPELNSHQTTDNQKLWSFLLPGFHSTSTCPFYSTQSLFNYNRSPQQFSGDPSLNLNVHRTTSTYQKSPVSMFSTRMSQTYGEREELLLPNCLFLEFANLSNKLYALDFSTQQILINRPDMYLACCQKKYLASIDEGRLLKSKWITNIHSLVDIFDALKH